MKSKNAIFYSPMTFQYKSLIPIIKLMHENGFKIFILSNFKRFNIQKIRNKPRSLNIVNRQSLKFVCEEILYDSEFLNNITFIPYFGKLSSFFNYCYSLFDPIFISTTKGFTFLNQKHIITTHRIAIPYQNFKNMYYAKRGSSFPCDAKPRDGYEKEVVNKYKDLVNFCIDLPYLKKINIPKLNENSRKKILFLHPGGYRNVVSNFGDDLNTSIKKQGLMYNNLIDCLPSDWVVDIKIHPLAARFHDYKTNKKYFSSFINFVNDPLLKSMSRYELIVSFGSSSYYELKYFNKPYYNLAFIKNERSDLYKDNNNITLHTKKDFTNVLINKPFRKLQVEKKDKIMTMDEIVKFLRKI